MLMLRAFPFWTGQLTGALVPVLMLLCLAVPAFAAGSKSVQQIILYKNAWVPLEGNSEKNWLPHSHAYTASTFYMPFDELNRGGARLQSASLLVVWQALSPASYTGVGLFVCPPLSDVNHDLTDLCWWNYFAMDDASFATYTPGCAGSGPGPHPCRKDVTEWLNWMILNGEPRYLAIGSFGNGHNGPYIYDVELQLSWE